MMKKFLVRSFCVGEMCCTIKFHVDGGMTISGCCNFGLLFLKLRVKPFIELCKIKSLKMIYNRLFEDLSVINGWNLLYIVLK